LDDFLLVLLVDWSGLMGLGDEFSELLDFEFILEEKWQIGGDFCWFWMRGVDLVD
jgi:hypothetical protein